MQVINPASLTSVFDMIHDNSGAHDFELPSGDYDTDRLPDYPQQICSRPWYLRPSPAPPGTPSEDPYDLDYPTTDYESPEEKPVKVKGLDSLDNEFKPDYEVEDPYAEDPPLPPPILPDDFDPSTWEPVCPSLRLMGRMAEFYVPRLVAGTHELTLLATPLHPGTSVAHSQHLF
jgi:hypothetical protein